MPLVSTPNNSSILSTKSAGEIINYTAFAALKGNGTVVTWGDQDRGGNSTSVSSQLVNVSQIFSSSRAFAALKGDGTVVTWGLASSGGDSTSVSSSLTNVTQIFSTDHSFAALKNDGSVVTWGLGGYGGDSTSVSSQLTGVSKITSSLAAFAALKTDGTVVTWGNPPHGSDSSGVQSSLTGVKQIFSNLYSFAALKHDGTVVTWGTAHWGGNSSSPSGPLVNVTEIFSHKYGYAALKSDGTVVYWPVASQVVPASGSLVNIRTVSSTESAFAALKNDGTVVSWGSYGSAGDSSGLNLTGVSQIVSTDNAFAALKNDGSVVAWGDSNNGGSLSANLTGVSKIFSNSKSFVALKTDGTVHAWGGYFLGGNMSGDVYAKLTGVVDIFETPYAFAALKSDGTVVTWGSNLNGADSSGVASQLTDIVSFATPFYNDVYTNKLVFSVAAASLDGSKVILTYDRVLSAAFPAIPGNFSVTVAGSSATITGVSVSGSTIELTLLSAIASGQIVTVAYTDPTAGDDVNAVQDSAGNDAATLASSSVTNSIPDTTPPAFPAGLDLAIGSDSGVSGTDNITSLATPVITGTAEALSTVRLYDTDGITSLGSATVDAYGAWSITTSLLSAGSHSLTAKATDLALNTSVASPAYVITIDRTGPSLVSAIALSDTALRSDDSATVTFVFSEAVTGFTVAAINAPNGSLANLGSSDGGTTWTATLTPSASTTAASNVITLDYSGITDLAGNAGSGSANSSNYAVDTFNFSDSTPPLSPIGLSLTSTSDTGLISTDRLTSLLTPTITGIAEALSVVVLYGPDFVTSLGMATADVNGAWSITTTPLAASIVRLTAQATDAAGNVSSASEPLTLTIDPTPPAVPTALRLTNDSDTGISSTDRLTSYTAPTISGIAEAYSNVVLYSTDGNAVLGSVFADSSGSWSMAISSLPDGTHYLAAKAIDLAGNSYGASDPFSVTVDTAAPAAPSITSITNDAAPITGTVAPGGFTNDTSLDLTGTAEAASTVSIYNGSILLGTTTANNTGAWSYGATGLSGGSTYSFKATATDAAGNISPASSPNYSVTVDTTSPSPSPSGITSANANGRYGFGSTITLQLSFTETVYITGSPSLLLETGSTDRAAVYKSGSGTNTLSFDYTVQLGDRSADLDIVTSAALSLQGGSIQDAAGNGASLTLPAPGAPGSLGANAALVIDDSAPSAGSTFTTTQGASGLINKPVVIYQTTDPLTGGSVVANTLLVFNNATPDSTAASGLQLRVNSNGSNPAATVTSASDLISFSVSPSVSTSGNVSNLDVNGITTSAVAVFQATIQEVDLYFPEAAGSGWNALCKKNKNGGYFLFNYDPLTGLGGILLDRDGINGIDGARLYLKDGALGDFDETVNGRIDDPIGFTTLSTAPSLQLSGDGKGLTVNGIDGTGLWISLAVSFFSSAAQSNLEMYNNDQPLGTIGATLGSGPTGSQAIYLAAGSTLSFRSSDGVGNSSNNPALSIASTPTGYSLGLDADRNGSYTDLMLDISSSITASSPASLAIARKQLSSSDAILDLTSIAATGITLSLDISTDCGLRNRFGFVKLDPLTGTTYQVNGVSQSDGAAFRSAVLSQFIDPFQGTTTSHRYGQSRQSISWALASSAAGYYAPVMVTQGGEVFTFGASTASDGRQHVKLLGTNIFGFEDLLASQGSDWDFNDTKIRVSVA